MRDIHEYIDNDKQHRFEWCNNNNYIVSHVSLDWQRLHRNERTA